MLAICIVCFYILITTAGVGLLVIKQFERLSWAKAAPYYQPDLVLITGFAVITAGFSYYSLFFRVGGPAPHVLLLSVSAIAVYQYRAVVAAWFSRFRDSKKDPLFVAGVVAAFPLLFYYAIQAPPIYDTALYHAQTIQWIEKFPVVPGLGNLHGRLAFNSSLFIVSALYGFSDVFGQTIYAVNTFFAAVLFLRLAREARYGVRKDLSSAITFLALLLLIGLKNVFTYNASPHTDLLPLVFIVYTFILITADSLRGRDGWDYRYLAVLLMVFSAVACKLSAVPIVLLLVFFAVKRDFWRNGRWTVALLAFTLVVVPWIIRNVVVSGYLVYPFPALDLFSFDWKIPLPEVIREKTAVKGWAIMPTPAFLDYGVKPFWEWFPGWFRPKSRVEKLVLFACFVLPFLYAAAVLFRKQITDRANVLAFCLVCYAGQLFWILNSPDYRFGYGFLFFCFIIPVAYLAEWMLRQRRALARILVGALVGAVYTAALVNVNWGDFAKVCTRNTIYPEKLATGRATFATRKIRNAYVTVPLQDDRCFTLPIPCANSYNPALELRGDGLRDGFRVVN